MLPHQQQWWDLTTFYKIMLGGYGSGKTHIGAYRSIYLSYLNAPLAGMYVSPSHGLSQRTIVVTLKDIMDKSGIDYTYNQMKGEFLIHNWDGRIWLGSGDKPDSLKGSNICWAGIDEPFIQKKDVFDQMVARVRHPEAKAREIFVTGTPEQLNWGYDLCNRTDIDLGMVVGSTLENEHLPEDYKTNLLAAYSQEQIDAYVHGKFVNLTQGRVYKEFDRNKRCIERNDLDNLPVVMCMDFNVDYSSAIALRKGTNWVHAFKEYRMMNATTYDMAEAITKDFTNVTVYCDSSGNARRSSSTMSDFNILRSYGLKPIAPPKNPPVRDRVNCVNKLIRDGNFSVQDCPSLVMDLERNVWKGQDIDKKDPAQTHMSDAFGYLCNVLVNFKPQPVSVQW